MCLTVMDCAKCKGTLVFMIAAALHSRHLLANGKTAFVSLTHPKEHVSQAEQVVALRVQANSVVIMKQMPAELMSVGTMMGTQVAVIHPRNMAVNGNPLTANLTPATIVPTQGLVIPLPRLKDVRQPNPVLLHVLQFPTLVVLVKLLNPIARPMDASGPRSLTLIGL